jgi:hypothetical protein
VRQRGIRWREKRREEKRDRNREIAGEIEVEREEGYG